MTALAGANIIYGVGMLELGITIDYAQLVISNDIIRMVRRCLGGIDINDESLAVDVIDRVGSGNNFIMEEHTMKHMREEQSVPYIMDRRMRYAWEAEGSKDLAEVAREKALDLLENYQPKPLSDGVKQTLQTILDDAEKDLVKR